MPHLNYLMEICNQKGLQCSKEKLSRQEEKMLIQNNQKLDLTKKTAAAQYD